LIEVYFDGLCQPINPGGIACYAFLVRKEGKIVHSDYGVAAEPYSKDSTNNVAEYTAIIKALEWISDHVRLEEPIRVFSDSRLVVSQLNGDFKIKSKRILPLYERAVALKNAITRLEVRWIPREENREADALTNRAYKECLRSQPRRNPVQRKSF
jgi:ribonuclease HI